MLATGGIAGDGTLDELIGHAEAAGREAARQAARQRREVRAMLPTHANGLSNGSAGRGTPADAEPVPLPELPVDAHPELFRASTHGIVDFCEDVSSKDLVTAVREGYDSIELAKRYTTATMGPTQGKLEAGQRGRGRGRRPPARPSPRPARRPGARPTPRSRSARWRAGPWSPCGTPRCSRGTRRTTPAR